jgi:hypothetical protein
MTRRETIAAAAVALAACPATARVAAAQAMDGPNQPQTGPMVDQLIQLAEHGGDTTYYGRLLAHCLEETGTVAKDNGDGTVSLYSPDRGAWTKRTVRSSVRPMPVWLLTHVKRENRGQDFPAGTPFRPLGNA